MKQFLVYEIDEDIDGADQIEAQTKKLFPFKECVKSTKFKGVIQLTFRYDNDLYDYLNQLDEGTLEKR